MIRKNKFSKEKVESSTLSLVQFKTEWNGACQILSMIYDDLSKSYTGVVDFYTVDYDQEKSLSKHYGIMEVPTILFFRGGKVVDHTIGLIPKNVLITKIENALSETDNRK